MADSVPGISTDTSTSFARRYRERADPGEVHSLDAADLDAAITAHRELAARREASETLVEAVDLTARDSTRLQVVTPDGPWLVASLRALLESRNHLIRHLLHPVLDNTSFMHIELQRVDPAELPALERAVRERLEVVDLVRDARDPFAERLKRLVASVDDLEQAAFLAWLDNRQFVGFGAALVTLDESGHPLSIDDTLGLLDPAAGRHAWAVDDLLPARLDFRHVDGDVAVIVCKSSRTAPLIRNEAADLVLLADRDESGRVTAVDCLFGLFVPGLQNEAVDGIPWMRERVQRVFAAAGVAADSHDGKAIATTLRGLPRDMLLQTRSSALLEMARGIVALHERRQTRLFSSVDPLGRYWNCLVFLPNDVYTRDLRLAVERILERGIDGFSVAFDSRFSSASPLARIHLVIRRRTISAIDPDWSAIETAIALATVSWDDRVEAGLHGLVPAERVAEFADRYRGAFPAGYRETHAAVDAAADIAFIEARLGVDDDMPVMGPVEPADDGQRLRFKVFAPGAPIRLSDAIPLIENLGFRVEAEHPFDIARRHAPPVSSHVMTVAHEAGGDVDPLAATSRLQAAFHAAWTGEVENDGFNRLVFGAGLDTRQADVLRALAKYLLQTRAPFSLAYVIDTLEHQPGIARSLVELFERRLHPESTHPDREGSDIIAAIEVALDAVSSLDGDRIIRRLMGAILAVLRTNRWCTDADGRPLGYLSMKFDCARVPSLPRPRPLYEIFVASTRVDGVHLRGGKVARGGLRWSDRREDYRTEVLGLMKAQMVKNAVIVPVGSKGGFFVKAALPPERDAAMKIVVDCYRTFLRGLLDVTDNIVDGKIVPPARVHRLDGDDPYLVVAADKGTATFSDHANAVARDYGFWLDDAFASGGSVGYDHKKMGITARGAWESVKRHFRGLGIDTQTTPFTAMGIGDMGGDVFGNGMLLSKEIRLVAAFNHQHVFIDPAPPTHEAWCERKRLFDLPGSSWADYDRSLISAGGGIFARADKSIALSPEARAALGTDQQTLTPDELVSIVLRAPVDLLWNGGIGTYVKASTETDLDVADRANDAVRVDARNLRCRVVGEGGNLGFTQLGRIEYALGGGLNYTDAVDNSAGVDCSDHEVNIKILVNAAIINGKLDAAEREPLLESMTDEVGDLVLADNYLQTQCIDLHHAEGPAALESQSNFILHLESIYRLDREVEYLPTHEAIAERLAAGGSLTRPEIAVLVSYAKMSLYDDVLASALPDQPSLVPLLVHYFPTPLRERHRPTMSRHRLAREIVATVATNETINRLGPVHVSRLQEEFGVTGAVVVQAFLASREIFALAPLWASIETLDNRIGADIQLQMHALVRGLAERGTYWILRTLRETPPDAATVERWRQGVADLRAAMPDCLSDTPARTLAQRSRYFVDAGTPADVATEVAGVVPLSSALDVVEIAHSLAQPVADVAALYFELGDYLDLHWLRDHIAALDAASRFQALARAELRSDLHYQHRHLAAEICGLMAAGDPEKPNSVSAEAGESLSASGVIGNDTSARLQAWAADNSIRVQRYRGLLQEIRATGDAPEFSTLSLAVNALHKLLRTNRPLGIDPSRSDS